MQKSNPSLRRGFFYVNRSNLEYCVGSRLAEKWPYCKEILAHYDFFVIYYYMITILLFNGGGPKKTMEGRLYLCLLSFIFISLWQF